MKFNLVINLIIKYLVLVETQQARCNICEV